MKLKEINNNQCDHCFCQTEYVDNIPHYKCCMCGTRKAIGIDKLTEKKFYAKVLKTNPIGCYKLK